MRSIRSVWLKMPHRLLKNAMTMNCTGMTPTSAHGNANAGASGSPNGKPRAAVVKFRCSDEWCGW